MLTFERLVLDTRARFENVTKWNLEELRGSGMDGDFAPYAEYYSAYSRYLEKEVARLLGVFYAPKHTVREEEEEEE